MLRVITVLGATFLFAVLGLVIGHLSVTAQQAATGGRLGGDTLLTSYLVAPVLGAIIGFALAITTMKLVGPRGE